MPDVKFFNFHQMSNDQIRRLKTARWRARTDLKFLCNHVLKYPDVCHVHDPLINHLQKFPGPVGDQFVLNDDLRTGFIKYTPVMDLKDFVKQEKIKRRLILDFRGSLKTTINVTAHPIQWILNYPNIGILIIQSSIEKAEEILQGIKLHFQYNSTFRELFPEHVPHKRVEDWCTKGAMKTEAYDVNNLALGMPHREGSIITGGIDKGMAGKHLDVLKFSDIVDPSNTKTEASCIEIIKQYQLCENLLTSPMYWIDVEGTRYSFADLYGKIIKDESKVDEDMRVWSIYARGCYQKETKDGSPQKFTPDELKLSDKVDKSLITKQNPLGKVSWWPERYPAEILENKRRVAPYEFATQMYNNPQSAEEGMIPFPVTEKYPKFLKRKIFEDKIPKAYYEFSIDTGETDNQRSNYTSIAIACWTGSGNCVIVEIVHGKFLPDKIIEILYQKFLKYNPRNIKIEETSFVRGLMAGIRKTGEIMKIHLPIELIKRDNKMAKQERIINTLQPYYINGQLIFLDDLDAMDNLLEELHEFPTGTNDDILDSLADLFQNKEHFGREFPSKADRLFEMDRAGRMEAEYRNALPKMTEAYLGIGNNDYASEPSMYRPQGYDRTGGL